MFSSLNRLQINNNNSLTRTLFVLRRIAEKLVLKFEESRCIAIPIYGISLIIIIGLINGFYKEALFNQSQTAFWAQDIAHFVIIPTVLLHALHKSCGYTLSDLGLIKPSKSYPLSELIGASVFTALMLYITYISVLLFSYHLLENHDYSIPQFSYHSVIPDEPSRIFIIIYLAITAAVVEEVVYRGIPYKLMTTYKLYGRKTYVIGFSLLFACIHWENGYHEVMSTFILGLLAAFFYLSYKNLWPLIGGHFLIDLYVFW